MTKKPHVCSVPITVKLNDCSLYYSLKSFLNLPQDVFSPVWGMTPAQFSPFLLPLKQCEAHLLSGPARHDWMNQAWMFYGKYSRSVKSRICLLIWKRNFLKLFFLSFQYSKKSVTQTRQAFFSTFPTKQCCPHVRRLPFFIRSPEKGNLLIVLL